MNSSWILSIAAVIVAVLCIFGWFSITSHKNEGDFSGQKSRSAPLKDLLPPDQRVESHEFELFMESLYATEEARQRFFERNKPLFPSTKPSEPLPPHTSSSQAESKVTKPAFSAIFRKYNFSTFEQFEEEFDCDIDLLFKCESTLLQKVMLIEETIDTRQGEALELCQSVDNEFFCLKQYAEKCEQKMNKDNFQILRYLISKNNGTIISCRTKEKDWIGFDVDMSKDDDRDECVDEYEGYYYPNRGKYQSQPCIPPAQVYKCFNDSFEKIEFDLGRQVITTRAHCEALWSFDRCAKRWIFETISPNAANCTLEEKETSLEILRGMFIFDLSNSIADEDAQLTQCKSIRDQWSQSKYTVAQKKMHQFDAAFRMTETLRSAYQRIKGEDCLARTVLDDELCLSRFERRLRKLWHRQGIDNLISWQDEKQMMCCSTAELSSCMAIFALIRCGLDQFVPFQSRVEFIRIASLPEECVHLPYSSAQCYFILN